MHCSLEELGLAPGILQNRQGPSVILTGAPQLSRTTLRDECQLLYGARNGETGAGQVAASKDAYRKLHEKFARWQREISASLGTVLRNWPITRKIRFEP
jgi:hypothetical protein